MKTDGREEAFRSVELMLHSLAHAYHRSTGIDREELYAEACLGFASAYESYDWAAPRCFPSWVHYVASNRLRDLLRSAKKHSRTLPLAEGYDAPERKKGVLAELLSGLSDAAGELVRAASDPPPDVVIDALSEHPKGTARVKIMRRGLKNWLARKYGCEAARETFAEVAEALRGGG